ncbi:hypothetical protein D9C73_010722 [Collichthys lucidus]|uniref:Uncharacterized protein n=1 Tax=Collichthys lucidus TaxID=240159 RepID=A0A4U5UNR6_COLLU|nr:hypothetical protein D9C73_010722 [Collichthys lucidus]
MGNENSKSHEPTKNGTIPEKHGNGSVNGVSASITSNGLDFNGETVVKTNGGPLSLNHTIDLTEPDCVVVESVAQKAEAPVISETPAIPATPANPEPPATPATPEPPATPATPEPPATPATPATPEPAAKKEEAKKNKGEKARGFGSMFKKKPGPPAEPVEKIQEKEIPNGNPTDVSVPAAEPQPESGSIGDEAATTIVAEHREDLENLRQKAEVSTQTDTESKADISTQTGDDDDDDTVIVETAETVVMAEEVFEETAGEDPRGDETAEISIEEVVVMGNDVYEYIVFRAEQVEITENFEISHVKTDVPEMPEISAEPELTPNKSITECEIVTGDNNVDEAAPSESFSLPKVVADCVNAVFAADSDSAAVNTSQPRVAEVITKDNIEEARDVSSDAVLIKVAEPEYNAVTPEAGKANDPPSLDEKPVTMVAEAITEVVCEEPNPTSANRVEELSDAVATQILVKEESAHEEVNAEDAVKVNDDASSIELISFEELLEDILNSPDNEVKCIPEVIATGETSTVGEDVIVHEGTVEEANPGIVKDKTEMILEAAIDVLSLEFSAITPQDPATDIDLHLEEEVIVATYFMPLSEGLDPGLTISEEPTAEELNEEAMEALSDEFEAVPGSVEDDTGGEVTSSSDPVGIKTKASDDVLLVTGESQPHVSVQEELVAPSVVAVEEPTDPSPVVSEEPVEQSASPLESQMIVVIVGTAVDEVTEEAIHEMDDSGDVSTTVAVNTKDSEIVASDELMAECVEAVLETIVEEIIVEDVTAECNLVTTVVDHRKL